jgi:hypothetical protein
MTLRRVCSPPLFDLDLENYSLQHLFFVPASCIIALVPSRRLIISPSVRTSHTITMTQVDNSDAPQDDYEEVPGGPGAPIPVSQLVVRVPVTLVAS